MSDAKRFNKNKVDLTLLPKTACLEEAKVWMAGREKYGKDNWKNLWGDKTVDVAMASLMRHAFAILDGQMFDSETGLPHAANIRCNAAMILEYMAKTGTIQPDIYSPKVEKPDVFRTAKNWDDYYCEPAPKLELSSISTTHRVQKDIELSVDTSSVESDTTTDSKLSPTSPFFTHGGKL